jgi:threonine dehydratase
LITDIEREARDADQLQGLVDALRAVKYQVKRVELNYYGYIK